MPIDAYIALGSNLGDRELNLLRGVAEIGRLSDSKVTGLSPFYETSPVATTDPTPFYNAVLRLNTEIPPHDLLHKLLEIETLTFQRIRNEANGPRRLDLDLLLYGAAVISEEGIEVPHPRLAERRFVLQPLHDIAPGLVHPKLNKTVATLLGELRSDETVRPI